MMKSLTLDLLWILSSQGLLALYPVSHYDSSTAIKNGGDSAIDRKVHLLVFLPTQTQTHLSIAG